MKRDSYKVFGELAQTYGNEYHRTGFSKNYPANKYRLEIVLKLIKKINPKKILDVGCGTADPMIKILNGGFNIRGFDLSDDMIDMAKKNLKDYGYPEELVTLDNMESIKCFDTNEFDCAIALGSVYYARNFNSAMSRIIRTIKPNGHFIFSLRNELFSLFSVNKYTAHFILNKLIEQDMIDAKLKNDIHENLKRKFLDTDERKLLKNVDDMNIHSIFHNPLTVEAEVCKPHSLELKNIFFYHYHALPPIYEEKSPIHFRKLSAGMERPLDWKGYFMASAFVVHAVRI